MQIGIELEEDGRWLTEIPDLPGVMAYGQTQAEAQAKVKALALRVLADRLEHWRGTRGPLSRQPGDRPSARRQDFASGRCSESARR